MNACKEYWPDLRAEAAAIGGSEASPRLDALVDVAPGLFACLAEPWEPLNPREKEIVAHCARLHLYSRALDDALDEGEPEQKTALLRAQPLLWRSIASLTALAPSLADACEKLIAETIEAVIANDREPDPALWGLKNHHLLLAPLILRGDEKGFADARGPLSSALTLLQACEEWIQGTNAPPEAYCEIIVGAADNIEPLARLGFYGLASRARTEGRALLAAIESFQARKQWQKNKK